MSSGNSFDDMDFITILFFLVRTASDFRVMISNVLFDSDNSALDFIVWFFSFITGQDLVAVHPQAASIKRNLKENERNQDTFDLEVKT